ncbi:uncharacterized protein LY89DRAFT_67974 [Mollisia scopiformis]|uniref:Uncharacterized protein n=1 Tax=Mollisia scopiformis TaxID=149040 RepID=A0A194X9U7_MOLSC|nr:uncharacterized protein LY89DRAFT_67974 [Mollisia scopiformis]KUJ16936.1 hypothetical protein LY89DRAFT_67974 [Mollisia scopiformis]
MKGKAGKWFSSLDDEVFGIMTYELEGGKEDPTSFEGEGGYEFDFWCWGFGYLFILSFITVFGIFSWRGIQKFKQCLSD